MKSCKLPAGLYNKWLGDYRKKHPGVDDVWHKYQYLHQRTMQYFKEAVNEKGLKIGGSNN